MQNVATWTPALRMNRFSSYKSKEIFKEFQFTLYSCMLMKALAGNILFYILLMIANLVNHELSIAADRRSSGLEAAVGGIFLHLVAIALQRFCPRLFRIIYFPIIVTSILLIEYVGRYSFLLVPGTLINTCHTILFLLVATIYFQNSTLFLSVSCMIRFIINFVGKVLLVANRASAFPGSVPITAEVRVW